MGRIFSGEAFAVLRINNYKFYLAYRFFITAATIMQSVIVGWHLYSITKSVFLLGLIGLTEVIPQVGIALFAGHYVDLWDRKKIIKYTTLLLLLGSLILMVYSISSLNCYEMFGTLPIFITIFLTGLARGVLMPAHAAFLGQLVPRELYANAATWNSTNWQVAAVLGPAIGGLIYGFGGTELAYITVFSFYLISFLVLFNIKYKHVPVETTSSEGIFSSINQGLKYVFNNQILLGAFSLDMFAVLFGGAVALLPVFASDVLKVGPQGLGLLRACPAIGAIIMSAILLFYPPVKNTGKLLFSSVAGFGLCMIGFALSKDFFISAFLLLFSGIFDNISVVIRGTILQLYTTDEMKGRVASVNSIFIGSSNELGAFESGTAARFMGLIPSVVFGGAMTLLVVAVAYKSALKLRTLSLVHAFRKG